MMKNRKEKEVYRSFNVLGQSFQIRVKDLNLYPSTFLADPLRLQSYWNPHLNAYFFSRNVQIFERTILPFYRSKTSTNRIKFTSMISTTEKQFRDELKFYDLCQYYQIDDIQILFVEFSHLFSSSIYKDLKKFLLIKCFCQNLFDFISSISCALGIIELILYRCSSRHWTFVFVDICCSLILLTVFFSEQRVDRLWLKIQLKFQNEIRSNFVISPVVLVSHQSFIFLFKLLLTSFSFIFSIVSFSQTTSFIFIVSIAFRHFLLIRLCLPDFCHLIDLFVYSGRSALLVLSRFFLLILTFSFICIWLGLIVFIIDSNPNENIEILRPSRYVYFISQILFNVGYGDTIERRFLSFIFIVVLTLLFSPLLLLTFENFLQQIQILTNEYHHVKTFHRSTIFDEFFTTLRRLSASKFIRD